LAALLSEKETISKELKAKLAALDSESRSRKKEQDAIIRDAKAAIDKEYENQKNKLESEANEIKLQIDEKISKLKNDSSLNSEL
jgi:hypothetical protein